MTRPLKYDNFVASQIDTRETYSPHRSVSFMGANQNKSRRKAQIGTRVRSSLKQKIDQLVGLCEEQNHGIKNKFRQVIGAQKEILEIMRQQLEQEQYSSFNNYAKSNVYVPSTQDYIHPASTYDNYGGHNQRQNYNQSLPYSHRQGFDHSAPHLQNFESFRNQPQQGKNYQTQRLTYPQAQTYYPAPYVNQTQQNPQYGALQGNNQEKPNILRSKVIQVKQGSNNYPRNFYQNQNQYQDAEVQQLYSQVRRLRSIVNDYQNKLAYLNTNQNDQERFLLEKIKEQGQDIRQNTLALLRNTTPDNRQFLNYNPHVKYRTSENYIVSPSAGYGNRSQHDELRLQLQQLRNQCQQLHLENQNIKKMKSYGFPQ